jgi:putative transcriptional regulator
MTPSDDDKSSGVHCRLDELLQERSMTLTRLSELVEVSVVNLSILKNDRARAIRYSTLAAICAALDCEIGDLLVRADRRVTHLSQIVGKTD